MTDSGSALPIDREAGARRTDVMRPGGRAPRRCASTDANVINNGLRVCRSDCCAAGRVRPGNAVQETIQPLQG